MGTQVAKLKTSSTLSQRFAAKFGVDENKVMGILKSTAFKQRGNASPITDEQMAALMIVCDQYGLNPFVKEIYAYPDNGGIVPVVGVDGWNRLMNEHKQMDGIEFKYSEETVQHKGKTCHVWIEAIITRKDRSKPVVVREYFDEVVREVNYKTPWDTHPKRMHRHKTEIQAARVAFGYSGIYDEDEAERIIEKDVTEEGQHENVTPKPIDQYYTDEECNAFESKVKGYFKKGHSLLKVLGYLQSNGKKFTDDQKEQIEIWQEEYQKSQEPIEGEVVDEHKDFKDALDASEGDK